MAGKQYRTTRRAAIGTASGVAILAVLTLSGCAPTTASDPTTTPVAESATSAPEAVPASPSPTSTRARPRRSPRCPASTTTAARSPTPAPDSSRGQVGRRVRLGAVERPGRRRGPGRGAEGRPDAGAAARRKSLYCVWRDPRADTTFLSIRVAVVDSSNAYPHLQSALAGYDCSLDGYGYRCQKVSQNSQYPVTDGDTYSTRGDVGIHIQQSNVSTSGLLDDVITHVF